MATILRHIAIHFSLFAGLVPTAPVNAAEAAPTADSTAAASFTPSETAYIALADEFNNRLEKFWQQLGDLKDNEQIQKFYTEHDPAIEYLPKLLAFEREHTGEDVSLNALAEIASYAARGGDQNSPGFKARREALARMNTYEDRPLATLVISRFNAGSYDPQVTDYLRHLSHASQADPTLRAFAQLKLAEKLLSLRATRRALDEQLKNFAAGMPTRDPSEEQRYHEFLATLPSADELAATSDEAITLLEALAASGDSLRQPACRAIDPTNRLVRIDAEKSQTTTPLATKAAALLFEERHLRPGQIVPDLELKLIDGRPWSLTAQRGRVVVIQFSFTGCGPCAQMYPDLRKMHEEFGDRLSLITIMRDATPDHALEETRDGTLTWDVACDGDPGEVSTRWAVDGFPEIFVIDATGKITAVGPRGEQLHWRVAKLVAAKE